MMSNWLLIYRESNRTALSSVDEFLRIKPYTKTNETGFAIANAREFATRARASAKLVTPASEAIVDRFIDEWRRFRSEVFALRH